VKEESESEREERTREQERARCMQLGGGVIVCSRRHRRYSP
jgi:hypothetical protein